MWNVGNQSETEVKRRLLKSAVKKPFLLHSPMVKRWPTARKADGLRWTRLPSLQACVGLEVRIHSVPAAFWTRWPTEVPSNPYHSVILYSAPVTEEPSSSRGQGGLRGLLLNSDQRPALWVKPAAELPCPEPEACREPTGTIPSCSSARPGVGSAESFGVCRGLGVQHNVGALASLAKQQAGNF